MDETCPAAPLPILFTDTDASYGETVMAAAAIAKAGHALDWALRGDTAHHVSRWLHVTRASVLAAPDLEAALAAEGHRPEVARKLARRIAPLARQAPLGPDTGDDPWVGIAGAVGVPERERPVLLALAELALAAARSLAVPDPRGRLVIAPIVTSVNEPQARSSAHATSAAVLATRLDAPALLERELLDVLALAACALVDGHPDLEDWIPRGSDPTVRVRIPAEHPGVPFAFVPFVATRRAARDALADGALLDEALASAGRRLDEHQLALARNPH